MTIEWITLIAAAALLWLPYPLPNSLNDRLGANPPVRPRPPSVVGIMRVWTNWASFIAAGAGAFLLDEMAIVVEPQAKGVGIKVLGIKAAILIVGLVIHMLRMKKELNFFAPAAHLSGVTLGLCGPVSGGFAVVVGWLFAAVQKEPMIQLPVTAVVLGVAWYLLGGLSLYIFALNLCLLLLPHFLALMAGHPLLLVASEPKRFSE